MIEIAIAEGKAPIYRLEIQDVIRDFNGTPHQMIKMVISGRNIPICNAPLFVRVRNGEKTEDSWLVEVSPDADRIVAYFPVDFTQRGNVEFGYGDDIVAIFLQPKWADLQLLDANRVDKDVVVVDKKWILKEQAKPKK